MTSPKCTTRALVRYLVHLVVGMATMFVWIVGSLCSPSQFQRRYNPVCTVVTLVFLSHIKSAS